MNTKNLLIYAGLLTLGLFLSYLFFGSSGSDASLNEHIEEAHTDEQGTVVYTCSMHPQVRQTEPGNCPICGMELIPADNDPGQNEDNPARLSMTQASMKLAEIETTPVVSERAVSIYRLPGKVTENQTNVSNITAHFPGRIRNLYVDYEGTYVSEGDRLASIYSPELIAAQQELLETVKYKNQNPRLYEASRRKLVLWEFPESTINQIEESGQIMTELDFFSPTSGYVTQLEVSREDHIMEGDVMYRIVNLSSVWVDFQAFESNISSIQKGDVITFTVEALPDQTFESTVTYVDPFLNNNSRTATIRTRVDNPGNRLKPGMLATGQVQSEVSDQPHLLIPRSAIMWTGQRSIVYVQITDSATPEFEAREVVLGTRAGNYYVIESGLSEGERVVTNGTFKIDSAAQLSDKLSMMNRQPGGGSTQTRHQDHNMRVESSGQEQSLNRVNSELMPAPEIFKNQLKKVIEDYLSIKDALFSSDPEASSQAAQNLKRSLQNVDMSVLSEEAHLVWMDFQERIQNHTEIIAKSNDLQAQRSAFMSLSSSLTGSIRTFQVPGILFEQFCPMANNGEGATWLSENEQIQNPYYGQQMHNCGESIQKIEF